ncbi:MAG: hypothetical protein COT81_05840 [Candidatus Buchananbacteria bacterium CG10_big_fil_rev_8_21_14_0_10_42_9]|uniref:Uncharacterized protein n=1 Tax=Candidatus Buchananbacteria bacterium CG10_big_fil_rev_8_21_14_0_10_42_9 TaxID=1974526 RepID=A0A2H0W1T7_9BACT|nr:MAG: hypothetical protein COT81_05840 [Candidatus Buchananbacteria bacterium CG10_big_fil_rev_8_21_14_0_10_42_9]
MLAKQPNNNGQTGTPDEPISAGDGGVNRKWIDEHGDPSYIYLESLAKEKTQEALEKLKRIANDHNVNYNAAVTAQDLVAMIVLATQHEDGDESM